MVVILEKSELEKKYFKKKSKLENLTRGLVDGKNIISTSNSFALYNRSIIVIPQINCLMVYTSKKMNCAVKLASLYENELNEKFSVKKEYEENYVR